MNHIDLNEKSFLQRLFLYELARPFAMAEAEFQFVQNYSLRAKKWTIDPQEQKKQFMKELNIKSIGELDEWRRIHRLKDEDRFKRYVEYRSKRKIVIADILENIGSHYTYDIKIG